MSDLETSVLRMLRVFGPVSNAEIGRRLGIPPWRTYISLGRLVIRGYASHPKKQAWDITDEGRRVFASQPQRPLALFQESGHE